MSAAYKSGPSGSKTKDEPLYEVVEDEGVTVSVSEEKSKERQNSGQGVVMSILLILSLIAIILLSFLIFVQVGALRHIEEGMKISRNETKEGFEHMEEKVKMLQMKNHGVKKSVFNKDLEVLKDLSTESEEITDSIDDIKLDLKALKDTSLDRLQEDKKMKDSLERIEEDVKTSMKEIQDLMKGSDEMRTSVNNIQVDMKVMKNNSQKTSNLLKQLEEDTKASKAKIMEAFVQIDLKDNFLKVSNVVDQLEEDVKIFKGDMKDSLEQIEEDLKTSIHEIQDLSKDSDGIENSLDDMQEVLKVLKETSVKSSNVLESHNEGVNTSMQKIQDLLELKSMHSCNQAMLTSHVMDIKDGVFMNIFPDNSVIKVRCDFHTDGGPWIVFQRRGQFGNPVDFFNKPWDDYVNGFGDLNGEFWLGLKNIQKLADQSGHTTLRIDITDHDGNKTFAEYKDFRLVGPKFNLSIGEYSGNAGDGLLNTKNTGYIHAGRPFSAKDQDNDGTSGTPCAQLWKSGWWFNACFQTNLNGMNKNSAAISDWEGIIWNSKSKISLPAVEMKLKTHSSLSRV